MLPPTRMNEAPSLETTGSTIDPPSCETTFRMNDPPSWETTFKMIVPPSKDPPSCETTLPNVMRDAASSSDASPYPPDTIALRPARRAGSHALPALRQDDSA